MSLPAILVVMPVYNAGRYLRRAVDSILAQTFQDFRLLIVNDGSTDDSAGIAHSYQDERIEIWEQANQGPCAAMNRAIEYAAQTGIPCIARMDADDISLPRRLETELGLLEAHPAVAACSCNCDYIAHDSGEVIGASTVSLTPGWIRWELQHGLRGMVQGACLFRTAALVEAGGYRANFPIAEDVDLFLRLSERYELLNASEHLYQIRLNPQSLSLSDVHLGVTLLYYAVDCAQQRRAGRPERALADFQENPGGWKRYCIWREEHVLQNWRSSLRRKNIGNILFAVLLDPRRVFMRLIRKAQTIPLFRRKP